SLSGGGSGTSATAMTNVGAFLRRYGFGRSASTACSTTFVSGPGSLASRYARSTITRVMPSTKRRGAGLEYSSVRADVRGRAASSTHAETGRRSVTPSHRTRRPGRTQPLSTCGYAAYRPETAVGSGRYGLGKYVGKGVRSGTRADHGVFDGHRPGDRGR